MTGFIQEPFAKRLAGVFAAGTFSNLTAFIITILAARQIGPADFGIVAAAIALTTLVAQVFDLGLGVAVVRAYNAASGPKDGEELVASVLGLRVGLAALLVPAAFGLRWLVEAAFPPLAADPALGITATVTAGLLAIWGAVRSADQARGRFQAFAAYTWALGLLRLILFGILILGPWRSRVLLFCALYTGPLALLLLANLFASKDLRLLARLSARTVLMRLRSVLQYGAWVAISGTLFSLLPRLPQMAIAQGGTATDLGLFSAALTFLVVFSFMNDALRTVLLPRVSSLQKPEERRRYQERLWRYTPWLLLMMVTVLLGMALLQPILLGDAYRQSVVPFLVLGTGTCALSVLGLYNILMHSYGIPRADALVNFLRLAVLAGLLIFANPTPVSVSIAYSSVMVVGELLLFFTIRRRLQGERSE